MNLQKYIDLIHAFIGKRTQVVERQIQKFYIQMLDQTLAELGKLFQKYQRGDGSLRREDVLRYKRLDAFKRTVMTSAKIMSTKRYDALRKHLEESYEYSYDFMSWAIQKESEVMYDGVLLRAEIEEKAETNEISKIKLSETLEKHRAQVVHKISAEVTQGLTRGETYKQVADRVENVVEGDYNKAIRTVRTETKRVRESATVEAAQKANGQGVIMHKKWLSMRDERVRNKAKANHRRMHGQSVPVDEPFDLGDGVTAQAPGLSGTPYNDINCRCLTTYEVVGIQAQTNEQVAKWTFEEYRELREGTT